MAEILLPALCAALDLLILEQGVDGSFHVIGSAPPWSGLFLRPDEANITQAGLCEHFPFLESFLVDAREVWLSESGAPRRSGLWTERDVADKDLYLEARALRIGERCLLVLDGAQESQVEQAAAIQRARDNLLEHLQLMKEVEKKDILFHCIVHDLAGPLSAMKGSLHLLARDDLSHGAREIVERANRAVAKQQAMIQEILDVFAEQHRQRASDGEAIEMRSCIRKVIDIIHPTAVWWKINLRLAEGTVPDEVLPVVAERSRLERVLFNLVDNALRHTPTTSTVTIAARLDEDAVLCTIDDEGPGVPEELSTSLFDKLSSGKQGGGKAGLGLYFCRMTVERWGGTIGYQNLPGRGTRFWFRLPGAVQDAPPRTSMRPIGDSPA